MRCTDWKNFQIALILKKMLPRVKKHGLLMLIIVIVGLFHILTIRPGHNWGGDFALYIHSAKNIE